MARITWQNIQAPQLSTRDIALAGSQIGESFNRLGETLIRREDSLRKEATNAALANAYMAGTPEELAALRAQGLGGLDRRVDRLAFAQGIGQAEGQLLDRRGKQNELTEFDAKQWAGQFAPEYLDAAGELNRDGMDALRARMETDPKFAQYAFATQGLIKDAEGLYGQADTRRETGRHNQATERNAQAQTAIQSRSLALREQEIQRARAREAEIEAARRQATQLVNSPEFLRMDPTQARRTLTERTTGMPSWQQAAFLETGEQVHGGLTSYSDAERAAVPDLGTSALRIPLQVEANAAENRAKSDEARYVRESQGFSGQLPDVVEKLNSSGWAITRNEAATGVRQIMQRHPHLSEGDILAAAGMSDFKPGLVSAFTGSHWRGLEDSALRIAEARLEGGYGQSEALDVEAARQPFESAQLLVDRIRQQDELYAIRPELKPDNWEADRAAALARAEEELVLANQRSLERRASRVRDLGSSGGGR